MTSAVPAIAALRSSHERFSALTGSLGEEQVTAPSYASEWTIAQVASHLGSQAEIFGLFVDAGVAGAAPPESEVFAQIWGRWDALQPIEQVRRSQEANEAFVTRMESWNEEEQNRFQIGVFGMDMPLGALLRMRLTEHALHTWDVAVTVDPTATLEPDTVALIIDHLSMTVAQVGRPDAEATHVSLSTTQPERHFTLATSPEVSLADDRSPADPASPDPSETALLDLPAEALIRLVAGRLDPEHTPTVSDPAGVLPRLRTVFPGF